MSKKNILIDMKNRGYYLKAKRNGGFDIYRAKYMGIIPAWASFTGYSSELLASADSVELAIPLITNDASQKRDDPKILSIKHVD